MRVKKVEYIKDYTLRLAFSDNSEKIVDLEDLIKKSSGIFLPLKELSYFKQVELDDCQLSICWPNGADICPDVLYELGKEPYEQEKQKVPKKGRSNIRRLMQ